jgi:hypothetical protein
MGVGLEKNNLMTNGAGFIGRRNERKWVAIGESSAIWELNHDNKRIFSA